MISVSSTALTLLRQKYCEIERMRRAHERGDETDPHGDMRNLAAQFPGALRELDRLTLAEVHSRIALLDAVLDTGASPPRWAVYASAYHGLLRAALKVRRIAGTARELLAVRALLNESYQAEDDEPKLELFDDLSLKAILSPPSGRLNPWVFAKVAETFGTTADAVEEAVFGAAPI